MTTIATDGREIAADSLETGSYADFCQKLYDLSDGRIAGTVGDSGLALKLIQYVEGELSPEQWHWTWAGEGEAALLILGARVTYIDSNTLIEVPCRVPAAIGSGAEIAIGAMEMGASPRDALRIAAKRDVYTGGAIRVRSI